MTVSPLVGAPRWRKAAVVAPLILMGACAVGPDYVSPRAMLVDRYTPEVLPQATSRADGHTQQFNATGAVPIAWWTLFGSKDLDALVRAALDKNPTLQASEASLRRSQDSLRAGQGIFFPQASVGFDAKRERSSAAQLGSSSSGSLFTVMSLSGTVGYALDVFGSERRTVEALRAQTDTQSHETQAAYLALTANLVDTVIARSAYAAERSETEIMVDLETQELAETQVQVGAGTMPYSNLLAVQQALAATRALLEPLRQREAETSHLLATLQGLSPSEAVLPDIPLGSLVLPEALPISLPSELVRQRPDILAAEAQLHQASAEIGVATAALFPSFSLTGTYGGASATLRGLPSDAGRFWSVGPSVSLPLFQGGSLWYSRRAAIDAFQASQATYRQVVLTSFQQVADLLNALEHDAGALDAEVQVETAAARALALVQVSQRAGLVASLEVLAAELAYHQTRLGTLQAVAQRHQDTVGLFVALGGGWNARAPAGGGGAP